jgi:hypothetical protein
MIAPPSWDFAKRIAGFEASATMFVFMILISVCCFGLLRLVMVKSHFRPFTDVQPEIRREVTRKMVSDEIWLNKKPPRSDA